MAKDIPETTDGPGAKPDWALTRRERRAAERARQGLAPRRRRWPWVVVVLLLAGLVAAWAFRDRLMPPAAVVEEAEAAPEGPAAMQVNRSEWVRVEPATLRRTVKVIGPLEPARRADLAAEASGQVEDVAVRPGDPVTAGQVLVQIDVERLTLDLNLARSNAEATRSQLSLAEEQLARQQGLVERGVAAETSLDSARTNAETLRSNLSAQEDQIAAAELALSRATVRAPFDGVAAARSVDPGAVVGAGSPLLSVVDLGRLEMRAAASVSAGALVRPGQAVAVEVDGVRGQTFEGRVERIAPVAEEGTRTLTVFVSLDNAEGVLRGGMFATGEIVIAEAEGAIAVPEAAIREGSHVLSLRDDVAVRRDVTVVEDWPGGLVQVEGLSAGDEVIVADLPELTDGAAVELVDF